MQARLTTAAIGPDETDSVAQIFEHIAPAMRDLDGYAGLIVLVDAAQGRLLSLSLWESAEAMAASEAFGERIGRAETAQRELEIEDTTRYRVITFDLPK